jgi:hypothetical protein
LPPNFVFFNFTILSSACYHAKERYRSKERSVRSGAEQEKDKAASRMQSLGSIRLDTERLLLAALLVPALQHVARIILLLLLLALVLLPMLVTVGRRVAGLRYFCGAEDPLRLALGVLVVDLLPLAVLPCMQLAQYSRGKI